MTTVATLAPPHEMRAALLDPLRFSPPWLTSLVGDLTRDFPPRLPARSEPTTDQCRLIQAWCSRLDAQLVPVGDEHIAKVIAMLRVQFPDRGGDPVAGMAVAKGLMLALRGVPGWALEEAVERILQGRVPGLKAEWMPTAPQLRRLVDEIAAKARCHRVKLQQVLEARIEGEVSEAERGAMQARFAGLLAEMGMRATDQDTVERCAE